MQIIDLIIATTGKSDKLYLTKTIEYLAEYNEYTMSQQVNLLIHKLLSIYEFRAAAYLCTLDDIDYNTCGYHLSYPPLHAAIIYHAKNVIQALVNNEYVDIYAVDVFNKTPQDYLESHCKYRPDIQDIMNQAMEQRYIPRM